ncbi:MAG: hypothetical protein ACKV2T_07215 [Kofleriaceae bacterium]
MTHLGILVLLLAACGGSNEDRGKQCAAILAKRLPVAEEKIKKTMSADSSPEVAAQANKELGQLKSRFVEVCTASKAAVSCFEEEGDKKSECKDSMKEAWGQIFTE